MSKNKVLPEIGSKLKETMTELSKMSDEITNTSYVQAPDLTSRPPMDPWFDEVYGNFLAIGLAVGFISFGMAIHSLMR